MAPFTNMPANVAKEAQEIRKEYRRKYPNEPEISVTIGTKSRDPPKHSVLRRTKSLPKKRRMKKSKRRTKKYTRKQHKNTKKR